MSPRIIGEVRRGQLITTYGVGSIIAAGDESFMVAGLDRWPVRMPTLHEPRLERALRVSGFVLPPATEHGQDIPVVRFPVWASCPSCHKLAEHRFFTALERNRCGPCGTDLIPSRFVICCSRGHIEDFPYFAWVHAGSRPQQQAEHHMTIDTGGTTASLRDIKILCSCGLSATMEHAFGKNAMRNVARCHGGRPWLMQDEDECEELPRTLQRGASNVWFAVTASALSIPPWSEGALKLLNRFWVVLEHIPDDSLEDTLRGMGVANGTSYSVDDLALAVRERRGAVTADGTEGTPNLRLQEYEALRRATPERSKEQEFVCEPTLGIPPFAAQYFDQVMLVKRLREVRALQTFSRVLAVSPGERRVAPPLYDSNPGWLPGVEVLGEGIFLSLHPGLVEQWEGIGAVQSRTGRVARNYEARFAAAGTAPPRAITPKLLLVHSLAHALINQWALQCGYPAAALRERLYVAADMCGLLIYTATSDSAGSLGGVVALGEPGRLDAALQGALEAARWCSADPLCVEADSSGVDGLNLAACHACMLLPEVSCEEMNLFLDRGMLVGTPEVSDLGFFRSREDQ